MCFFLQRQLQLSVEYQLDILCHLASERATYFMSTYPSFQYFHRRLGLLLINIKKLADRFLVRVSEMEL